MPRGPRAALVPGMVCLIAIAGWTSAACGPAPRTNKAGQVIPENSGSIHGLVTLQGEAPPLQLELTDKDADICGRAVNGTRLDLGRNQGVGQTFVYLDGVPHSEHLSPRASTQLAQEGCGYSPHLLTLTASTGLEVVNNDPILHSVHGREATENGVQTVFNLAQPVQGQRTKVDTPLNTPGIIALTCEAGHPWMTAYILVADHPYVATTNEDGEFSIDGIPPGTYRLKMWHEGVRLKRVVASLQKYEYEDPYEITQEIVVPEHGDALANFALELRKD